MTRKVTIVWVAVAIGFGAVSSTAQDSSKGSPNCESVGSSFEQISAEIEQIKAEMASPELTGRPANKAILDAKGARLAQLAFDRECVRPGAEPDPVRGSGQPTPKWVSVKTYFFTNRKAVAQQGAITTYGADRSSGSLAMGTATVSIPTLRSPGDLNLPLNLWLFELPADPSKHFIIKSVRPLPRNATLADMRIQLQRMPRKAVLLFVHGFNVPFEDAALRTAQMSHDLGFPGVSAFFSWPSLGRPAGYLRDEEMAVLSTGAFNSTLDALREIGATEVYVVAHSMGNRVVSSGINERIAANRPMPSNVKALLLAAPDINADVFREQISPNLARLGGVSRTIYASNRDAALMASSTLHDFPRVGQAGNNVFTFNGFETVDASLAAPLRRAWGHSYVMDSPKVIRDMQALILQHRSAGQRGLVQIGNPPQVHWLVQ